MDDSLKTGDDDSFMAELDRMTPDTPAGQTHSKSTMSYSDLLGAEDLLEQMDAMLGKTPSSRTTAPLSESTPFPINANVDVPKSHKSFRWKDDDDGDNSDDDDVDDNNEDADTSRLLTDVRSFDKTKPPSEVSANAGPGDDDYDDEDSQYSYSSDDDGEDAINDIDLGLRSIARSQMRWLYLSHALSAWGDRMWEFAIVLLMIQIMPNTLLLSALFGFTEAATRVFAGPLVGDWVDHTNRLRVVKVSLMIGNGSIVLAAVLIVMLLQDSVRQDGSFWFLVVLLLLLGALSSVGSLGTNLAVEKEWVKIMCAGDSMMLSKTNSFMRRIDLICKLVAPIFVGIVISSAGGLAGTILIGVWNLLSMFPEYIVLTWTYRVIPALQTPKPDNSDDQASLISKALSIFTSLKSGWKMYQRLSVFRPAFALGMLYLTVLSFGSIMTAYVYTRGMDEAHLAIARGGGAIFGLLGTFGFPILSQRFGINKTGLISIWMQVSMLSFCVISTFFSSTTGDCEGILDVTQKDDCTSNRNTELSLLLTGVIVSRLGLWMFDLAVTQMLQERVDSEVIGVVNGAQSSIQNLMDLFGYVLGMTMNEPSEFHILAWISFVVTMSAALLYTSFYFMDLGINGISKPSKRSSMKKKKNKKNVQEAYTRLIEPESKFSIEDNDDIDDDELLDDAPTFDEDPATFHQDSSAI